MEDLLILILQALAEFLFELFAWWPWDWCWYWGPWNRDDRLSPNWTAALLSLGMGGLLGWASLYVFPAVLVKWAWLRVSLLFISPVASGLMAREMASWRQEKDNFIQPNVHFWIGLTFSIGFVWMRFAFAHRPA